ncbi:MAG: flagellar basal body L-ring protein FlgH [Alphaproteobacteria bacterium]|nr:flagellar basal body L-ring protein FlgH [Alphaproteobacteria bacterium]MBP7758417.1 flagellar basal body L-ring protein FlgH [Alphaproteobacteria bacterium]MBP7762412.1 flagellar basal body L-ring protein FlgH [Alphaproteobacteria bacterium]MBP7905434.1 flagellar basal body L-ring protein FlgH [Alphaproteobacteria bacterium]
MCKRNGLNKVLISAAACALMTGCATADRLSKVGEAPAMSSISNPVTQDGYQPVSLPMPAPQKVLREKNSLWQSDRVTFFKDQRASNIGDVITVLINIKDEAELDNTTQRTRTSTEGAGLDAMLGYEQALNRVLPQAVDNTNLAQFDSSSNHRGSGSIEREDEITMRMAALITQVLPNGNMVIHGKQEVLVNYEKRILAIDGVIRPEDIGVQNTVSYDQIAEARIIYGGEGQISDMQQPRYGQQIYDVIFPF